MNDFAGSLEDGLLAYARLGCGAQPVRRVTQGPYLGGRRRGLPH
jgi:hypothetical protein